MEGMQLVSIVARGVGIALAEFVKAIEEARKNNPSMFKKRKSFDLVTLESTLKSIEPAIREMERLNQEMGRSREELESLITKMEEGTKLLKESSNVRWTSKSHYMADLHAFDESFRKLLDTILKVQTARDQKEMLHLEHQKGTHQLLFLVVSITTLSIILKS